MQIIYLPKAEEDLSFWVKSGNKPILRKITDLTKAIIESPFTGIGKPEQLKYKMGELVVSIDMFMKLKMGTFIYIH